MSLLRGKTVLVTGGCGTVGRELIRQILQTGPLELRVIDSNESELFALEESFGTPYRPRDGEVDDSASRFQAYIGDVRDGDMLRRKMEGVDIVFHTAALKHVVYCERSPYDAVQTNVLGVNNIVNAALANDVERVIFTSSDKAVNPTSVMGTSKLMGERIISAANSLKIGHRTIFSSTRFGNVIGSRGSVVPTFIEQIKKGGPITLTDSRMSRFIMTIEESVRLVLGAAELARGGEVFVTKMQVMRIEDLCTVMIDMLAERFGHKPSDITVRTIGAKAGEKLYEELISEEEVSRSLELPELFVVLPAFRHVYEEIEYDYPDIVTRTVDAPYTSAQSEMMDAATIRQYLEEHRVLEKAGGL